MWNHIYCFCDFPLDRVSFKLKYLYINKFVEKYVLCYSDIDECTVSNPCHEKATCNDTFGSFNCLCDPGFTGDGLNCTDIDECEMEIHDCHVNGTCENKEGTFKCHCGPWYQPVDGYNGVETRNCTLGTNIKREFSDRWHKQNPNIGPFFILYYKVLSHSTN